MAKQIVAGRPRIKIDWDQFDGLCEIHCTQIELANWFDCSVDTIEAACKREKGMHFKEYFALKSSKGKASLRRVQYSKAISGSVPMLIWLGKQWLGQRDHGAFDTAVQQGKLVIKLDDSTTTDETSTTEDQTDCQT